jgi:cyclase
MKLFTIFQTGLIATSMAMTIVAPTLAEDEVKITVQKLSNTIAVLYGKGGNIGVSAGPDGVYIIDDQYAEMSDKIRAAIAGLSNKPVSYIINTHWHGDHIGGNENFGTTGSVIIAHDNVRKRMLTGGFVKAAGKVMPPAPKVALPVITFNDSLTLNLNGEEARLLHVKAAHTDGDSMVFFPASNIVHMGDTFFYNSFPFIDRDSGGSINGIIAATEMVLAKVDDKTQIIPGHGPVTDKAGLESYRTMCIAMREKIATMKQSGMSLEDVIAAEPTAAFAEKWDTWGPDWKNIFISALYDDAE